MKYILSILGFVAPVIAFAQFGSVRDIESFVVGLVNSIVEVLVVFIFIMFLYGMVKSIWLSVGEESRTEANRLIRNSIIALIVVISIWGIIQVAANTFL